MIGLFMMISACAWVTDAEVASALDRDGDGYDASRWEGGTDCDDEEPTTHPGAVETWYDGVDSDCRGDSDFDQDKDGIDASAYGGTDCDDTDPDVNPLVPEVPGDGIDNDCDGEIDEELGTVDQDEDGWTEADGDCDDSNPHVHPGLEEIYYNGVDDDCDPTTIDNDQDGDGSVVPFDCDDTNPNIYPGAPEPALTPLIDENCNGNTLW